MGLGEILVSIAVAILMLSGQLGKMNLEVGSQGKDKEKKDAK